MCDDGRKSTLEERLMKNVIKLFTIFTFSCLSLSSFAADDCNPEFDPYCGYDSGYGKLEKGATVLLVGGVVVIAAGLYFIFKNDDEDTEKSARIMADYHNGKGLRLTSYENIFNVSLFTPSANTDSEPLSNLSGQFKVKKNTYNLVNLSLHWQ
jgi:hypothetical protein